jgi:hypothetical protein
MVRLSRLICCLFGEISLEINRVDQLFSPHALIISYTDGVHELDTNDDQNAIP